MAKSKPLTLNSNEDKTASKHDGYYQTSQAHIRLATTPPKQAKVPQRLLIEITRAISNIRGWGSVEIFIQDHKVTQITERNIKKTEALLLSDDLTQS